MSAPVYGPPSGQPQGYGPPQTYQQPQQGYGPPTGQPGPAQGQQPQYAGPQQYGPPAQQPQPPVAPSGVGSPTQQSDDASGFFDGAGGSPAISFPKGEYQVWKGGIFTGVITKRQAKNFDTKKPEFWDSGDPVIDVVVEFLTQDRDGNNPLDDGRRRMFVTQKDTHIPDSMASVVKEATRQGFHPGGQLWVCKAGQRKGEKSDRNVWQARYTPPTAETLRILDALPPQGVSQQAANEVAAQASYTQPAPGVFEGGNPYQHQQVPSAGQAGPPPTYEQSPPQGYQQTMQPNPGPMYGQQQGSPVAYAPGTGPAPDGQQNPWAGQQGYQQPPQGQPAQTHNPYHQQ